MAKDSNPLEDWNANAQRTLEQTMEHTRGVLGQYFKFLEQTLSSYPSGGTEFGKTLKANAEKNIATAHEYLDKLSHATDLQDVVRVQTEFMQVQLRGTSYGGLVRPTTATWLAAAIPQKLSGGGWANSVYRVSGTKTR